MTVHRSSRSAGGAVTPSAPPVEPPPDEPDPGTVILADTFDRADGALGTSSSGHPWTHTAWTVAGNVCAPPTSGGYQIATLDSADADGGPFLDVAIEVVIDPNAIPDLGVVFRGVDANNWAMLNIGAEGDHWLCAVHQRLAGSFGTPLVSLVNPIVILGTDQATPFTARVEVSGSSGEVFVNDVSQGVWTASLDGSLAAGAKYGLMGNDIQSSTFNNFEVTVL